MITNTQSYTEISISASHTFTSKANAVQHPVWEPKKVYNYLEDMTEGFLSYKAKARAYYSADFAAKGTDKAISIDDLKEQIASYMPKYTLTSLEPRSVVAGKYYLYIDDKQMQKMADDPAYRAKVFGLMDSELQGSNGYTLRHTDGQNVTHYITGSIFSLAEANRSIEGVGHMPGSESIPYSGSCIGSSPGSASGSRAMVRNASTIANALHPGHSTTLRHSLKYSKSNGKEEDRATRTIARHNEKLAYRYELWLKDKSAAEELQDKFMLRYDDFDTFYGRFNTND